MFRDPIRCLAPMRTFRLPLALLAVLACSTLLLACGGPSKEEYERQMQRVNARIDEDIEQVSAGEPSVRALDAAIASIERAARDMEEIEPPGEVEQLHDDFVDAAGETAKLLERLRPLMEKVTSGARLDADEMERFEEFQVEFTKLESRTEEIVDGFEQRGYDIDAQ